VGVFRTANLAPERRAASWTAFYSTRFAPVNFTPVASEEFQAELRFGALGPVDFAHMRSNGYCAERTKAHVAATSMRQFGFIIVQDGAGRARHCGREAELGAGDVLVNDNTEPLDTCFKGPFRAITVRARENLIRSRLPCIDELRGLRLPASTGLTKAVSAMAQCLLDQVDSDIPADHGAAMACHLLDVLATCYLMAWQGTAAELPAPSFRNSRARQFIEKNLAAPDLSTQQVAAALRVSPRYLRALMAAHGETVSSLILRRRLEEAAKQLASPLWRDRQISDIAFSWGFKSSAHFARVFRDRYGMTPREYRRCAAC
jgi:AraC-like DNA-binding protein